MQENLSVVNLPKTATFQMRINPEIKAAVEDIFAKCGLTLTDAINVFLQQSINTQSLPFTVTASITESNTKKSAMTKEEAVAILMKELEKGRMSAQSEEDYISEEEILAEFGVVL
ncbi:MAG: type II toxin-antitoxin system RelB/DinJ family antitoxin [Faecalibacterium sp.]|nr:type II toxin-antitoxin system RelB/DinJ family antitoxin [Ruminococcus sp.]MCM1392545.1 type II toxin-antitoxin system RelB/DinJ family antitoxin [Ruminococcus sp.]MCM1486253.1 type II toxin-antitoxin system RelB/DinJ family antitoxin [Faecalibacterium sp.]